MNSSAVRIAVPVVVLSAGAALFGLNATAAQAVEQAASSSVQEFVQPVRTLTGFLASEHVPSYRCPAHLPYLADQDHAPWGTSLIPGVEIRQDRDPWPIGVSITRAIPVENSSVPPGWTSLPLPAGISEEGIGSSATNWTFETASYQVVLHCTNDPELSYQVDRLGSVIYR
jgi:hypothetical protein